MVAVAPADWNRLAACARHATKRGMERAGLEETLLQAILFYGFPRVVSAFGTLAHAWPTQRPPTGGALPAAEQAQAGDGLFDAIYAENSEAVRDMLRSYHEELHGFVLGAAYGRILTRPGLTGRQRELLAVGALASLDQRPQLIAHARGALALGATETEVREALFVAGRDQDSINAVLRSAARA